MDSTEAHAQKHLEFLGLGPTTYEPEPNRPPDFLTRTGVAVEVRRLNQHAAVGNATVALEYDSIPIAKGMAAALRELQLSSADGNGWFVSFFFRRPVPLWKTLRPIVVASLTDFPLTRSGSAEIEVTENFWLRLYPYSIPRQKRFTFGGYVDRDSGGWLIHEVLRNAQICSDEKRAKVAAVRSNYKEWWLLLVDHIGLGADDLEHELLATQPGIKHDWDRLIILNPADHTRAVELPRLGSGSE